MKCRCMWRFQPLLLIVLGVIVSYVEHGLAGRFGWPPLATYAPWFFMGIAAFFRRPASSFRHGFTRRA